MRYSVLVTYGNAYFGSRYASEIGSYEDAVKLRDMAVSKGYRDARIVSAPAIKKVSAPKRRSSASEAGPDGAGEEV